MGGIVETVTGKIESSELGITLSHEHLLINLMAERRGDGLIHNEHLVSEEVMRFVDQGGRTVVDLSSSPLTVGSTVRPRPPDAFGARAPDNVEALIRISRRTGAQVIIGCGFYRDPYLADAEFDAASVEDVARVIVRDLKTGIPGTSVRAALIGEVGSDKWFISSREEKALRASAIASASTGAPIYTHAARWCVGIDQVELLVSEGARAERIAVGHVDTVPDVDYALQLADLGVYVGIDTMFQSSDDAIAWRADLLATLCQAGYSHRVLLSQDVCVMSQLKRSGGPGFSHVLGPFQDAAERHGVCTETFKEIVQDNPRRYLSGRNP